MVLQSGQVLVAGGSDGNGGILASAELYDPASNAWTSTGAMQHARVAHTATLLPSGRVLVSGGSGLPSNEAKAEVFDPATGAWTDVATLGTPRYNHPQSLLADGKVLVTGGEDDDGSLASSEVFTGPTTSSTLLSTPCMLSFVSGQPFTLHASVGGALVTDTAAFTTDAN